ncbi:MAG: hypothetical protein ACI8PZ_005130 [Myxococcota bacterium]|jgi:hypothetical protein
MLLTLIATLAQAGCLDSTCPPSSADAAPSASVPATAPVPPIDQDRPDDIRTAVFALG